MLADAQEETQTPQTENLDIWELSLARDLLNRSQSKLAKGTFYKNFFFTVITALEEIQTALEAGPNKEKISQALPSHRVDKFEFVATKSDFLQLGIYVPCLASFSTTVSQLLPAVTMYSTGTNLMPRKLFLQLSRGIQEAHETTSGHFNEIPPLQTTFASLTEQWEADSFQQFEQSTTSCLVLWIADKLLEQAIAQMDTEACIFAQTPATFVEFVEKSADFGSLQYTGRIRLAIDCQQPKVVIDAFLKSGMVGNAHCLVNKESDENEGRTIDGLRNVTLSSGAIGFSNFVKFSTILWVGKPDIPAVTAFQKNGIVVVPATAAGNGALLWSALQAQPFLITARFFRILINSYEDFKDTELSKQIAILRTELGCYAPVLIRLSDTADYGKPLSFDQQIHNFPFCHEIIDNPTGSTEVTKYGFMTGIQWARPELVFKGATLITAQTQGTGTLTFHNMSATHVFPMDKNGKSDPFFVLFLNNEEKFKSEPKKKTLYPHWGNLKDKLKFEGVSPSDVIRIEVFDWDLVGAPEFEGQVIKDVWSLVSDGTGKLDHTFLLQPKDPKSTKQWAKCRGTFQLEVEFSFTSIPKHFGRPLPESFRTAKTDGIQHIVYKCLRELWPHIEHEGLFRLGGNSVCYKELIHQCDAGADLDFSNVAVDDIASLCKAYFAQLPEPLLPEMYYPNFQTAGQATDATKVALTRSLINKLPDINKMILLDLVMSVLQMRHSHDKLTFLHIVSRSVQVNKMSAANLAVCFSPTIILPRSINQDPTKMLMEGNLAITHLAWMIDNIDSLFPPIHRPSFDNLTVHSNFNAPVLCYGMRSPAEIQSRFHSDPNPSTPTHDDQDDTSSTTEQSTDEPTAKKPSKEKKGILKTPFGTSMSNINLLPNMPNIPSMSSPSSEPKSSKSSKPKSKSSSKTFDAKKGRSSEPSSHQHDAIDLDTAKKRIESLAQRVSPADLPVFVEWLKLQSETA